MQLSHLQYIFQQSVEAVLKHSDGACATSTF